MGLLGVNQEYVDEGFVLVFNQIKTLNERIDLLNKEKDLLRKEKNDEIKLFTDDFLLLKKRIEELEQKNKSNETDILEIKNSIGEIFDFLKKHFKETEKPKTPVEELDEISKPRDTGSVTKGEIPSHTEKSPEKLDFVNKPSKAFCLKCREKTEIVDSVIEENPKKNSSNIIRGKCKICGSKMSGFLKR